MQFKICSKCKQGKPLKDFGWVVKGKSPRRPDCKLCNSKKSQNYYRRNRETCLQKARAYRGTKKGRRNTKAGNLRKYGLTIEQREEMYVNQKGICPICGDFVLNKNMQVDHNHKTGEIRSLLCARCNSLLGWIEPNPKLTQPALDYLSNFS